MFFLNSEYQNYTSYIITNIFLHFMGWLFIFTISSVQFSHSVMLNSLWPHRLQHTRPPCPSPTPGVYWNSCPLSQWCHPTTSSSVVPFSSRLQSFSASGSFQMSQFFASGGQSIGASASPFSSQCALKYIFNFYEISLCIFFFTYGFGVIFKEP